MRCPICQSELESPAAACARCGSLDSERSTPATVVSDLPPPPPETAPPSTATESAAAPPTLLEPTPPPTASGRCGPLAIPIVGVGVLVSGLLVGVAFQFVEQFINLLV